MEQMIQRVFQEKMQDGTAEKIISRCVVEMIEGAVKNLTGYGSPLRKQLEERITPVLDNALRATDLSEYTTSISQIIKQAMAQTNLGAYAEVCKSVQAIAGTPKVVYGQTVKVTQIFAEYMEWLKDHFERDDFDAEDICEWDAGQSVIYLGCSLNVERMAEGEGYFSTPVWLVTLDNEASHKETYGGPTKLQFTLRKSFSDEKLYVNTDMAGLRIDDLVKINRFSVYMMQLASRLVAIDIDSYHEETDTELVFSEE